MPALLIFPFNGNGLEALDCLDDSWDFIGFVDDTPEKQGITTTGYPVFGREAFQKFPDAQVLAVPGSPDSYKIREGIINSLNLPEERFAVVIHPKATVSRLARIGFNLLVMAGVVITSNALIGNHVCILPNSVVHHDVIIGDWTLIGSQVTLAGSVRLGSCCYIGSGTRILNGVVVGDQALVGMGSVVIRNVGRGLTVAGNPARILT